MQKLIIFAACLTYVNAAELKITYPNEGANDIYISCPNVSPDDLNRNMNLCWANIDDRLKYCFQNGGGTVTLGAGRWKIPGTIKVPPNTTLKGVVKPTQNYQVTKGDQQLGTLLVMNNANQLDSSQITLCGPNAAVDSLSFFTEDLQIDGEFKPKPAITCGSHSDFRNKDEDPEDYTGVRIENIYFANAYDGIWLDKPCGRHLISNISGAPTNCGIYIDKSYDVGRIRDIHFQAGFNDNPSIRNHIQRHAFGIVLKGCDWEMVNNIFTWGYHVGMGLGPNDVGQSPCGLFSNIAFDSADVGLDIYQLQGSGVSIDGLNVAGALSSDNAPTRRAVWAHNGNIGSLRISNASFWGRYSNDVVRWETGASLQITNSTFASHCPPMDTEGWNYARATNCPAVTVGAGSAIITGNVFSHTNNLADHGVAVTVVPGATAVIANNVIYDGRKVLIGNQLFGFQPGTNLGNNTAP